MESWLPSWRPGTNVFCDFSSPCLWSVAPAMTKWCQVIQSAAPVAQNHLPETEDLMLQNATPLRKSAPWPPNISDEHVSCTAPATEKNVPRLPSFLQLLQNPHVLLAFDKVHNPLRLPRKTTSERPKVLRTCQLLTLFDFEMCFVPQRRALFRHLNFQKWSAHDVSCTFWLGHVLPATTARTFSTSQPPKVFRPRCALYILTWKCASRRTFFDISTSKSVPTVRPWFVLYILTCKCASCHNGVQFFISHLASWLRTRRFSEPTFRPSGATNHWKNTVFRDFATFSRACIFFLLALSLLLFFSSSLLLFISSLLFSSLLFWLFPPLLFHLSILSEVWLLNFLRS